MNHPYSRQQITEEDIAAVVSVLRSDYLTTGPKVPEFEEALAQYCGAKYAVAVSSATAGLHLAYRLACWPMGHPVLDAVPVMASPLSFVATTNAALLAWPESPIWFRDVDPATGCAQWPDEWTEPDRWCLVPVHYAGRAAPIPVTGRKASPRSFVIEDAAHALGAWDYDGCSRVGSCAHSLATVFSFHPVKPLTTGEGGAITTNDEGFARELKSLRSHGRDESGLMVNLGANYRMTDFQATLGISQLKRCDEMREKRRVLAEQYASVLSYDARLFSAPLCNFDSGRNALHLFPVRIKNGRRDEVKAKLNAQGIGAQKHYDPIIPLHPYYKQRFGYQPGTWPNAEAWAAEELSLPLHAGMTEADVETVVDALKEALA